ncbi:MAG TPA: hypothetical protein VI757_04940 [Bacteroidia bacterium]|nr:hypothetical protein [Bacteroidia bacterium]
MAIIKAKKKSRMGEVLHAGNSEKQLRLFNDSVKQKAKDKIPSQQ